MSVNLGTPIFHLLLEAQDKMFPALIEKLWCHKICKLHKVYAREFNWLQKFASTFNSRRV